MALAVLSIDLEARLAKLQTGLDQAVHLVDSRVARIASIMRTGLGVGLAASGFAALIGTFRSVAAGLESLKDLSEAVGSSVENLSALEDVAIRTGANLDVVSASLVRLGQSLDNAKPGSADFAAFKALGLDIERLREQDPAKTLLDVAVALDRFRDNAVKASIVRTLFGRNVQEIAPLLKDLAEKGELNAKVTSQQAAEAEKFNLQFLALKKNATDFSRALVADVIPALNTMFERARSEGWLAALFKPTELQKAEQTAADLGRSLNVVGAAFERAQALSQRSDLPGTVRNAWAKQAEDLRAQLEGLQAQALKATSAVKSAVLGDVYSNEGRNYLKPSLPDIAGAKDKERAGAKDRADRPRRMDDPQISQAMRDALNAIEQTDASKIERIRAQLDELMNLRASGIGGITGLDEAIENLRTELQNLDPAARAAADSWARVQSLFARTTSGRENERLRDVLAINEAFDKGKITLGEWVELSESLDENIDRAAKSGKEAANDLGLIFSSAAGRAIEDWQNLGDVIKGIGRDIAQLVLKKTVTDPLTKWIGEVLEGFDIFSLFGGATKSANGNVFGSSGLIPFAMGGVVDSPTLFAFGRGAGLMGEAGPEAILPLKRGKGGKLGVAGGVSLTVVNHIDSRTDQAQVAQAVASGVAEGQRALMRSLRAQGALA